MKIRSALVRGVTKLRVPELSKEAAKRLKWFDYYHQNDSNARLTCRHFDISPQTFYRWKRRYDPNRLESLEAHSRRPRHVRQSTASVELIKTVQALREEYPRWGKDKLVCLLDEKGYSVSSSMVGRIIKKLKERGVLIEPVPNYVSAGKRHRLRPYAQRKPKEYQARSPGDLVELDTLDLRPLPNVDLKHFTAHDVISRWNTLGVYRRATAASTTAFLDALIARMPFPVKAIQVDGGSEFEAIFEEECSKRGIKLFVLPPRSPKLNGGVERAHRTHTEEFYEITDSDFEIANLANELLEWEKTYNTLRPHQALGYLTPIKFLQQKKGFILSTIDGGKCH
jgi:putative transposase